MWIPTRPTDRPGYSTSPDMGHWDLCRERPEDRALETHSRQVRLQAGSWLGLSRFPSFFQVSSSFLGSLPPAFCVSVHPTPGLKVPVPHFLGLFLNLLVSAPTLWVCCPPCLCRAQAEDQRVQQTVAMRKMERRLRMKMSKVSGQKAWKPLPTRDARER